jgi:hypothetical protein
LKTAGSAIPVEAVEEEERPRSTAKILESIIVHSAKDIVVLATELASVQEVGEPIPSTDEVQSPTEGEEPVVETVGIPTLEVVQAPKEFAQG